MPRRAPHRSNERPFSCGCERQTCTSEILSLRFLLACAGPQSIRCRSIGCAAITNRLESLQKSHTFSACVLHSDKLYLSSKRRTVILRIELQNFLTFHYPESINRPTSFIAISTRIFQDFNFYDKLSLTFDTFTRVQGKCFKFVRNVADYIFCVNHIVRRWISLKWNFIAFAVEDVNRVDTSGELLSIVRCARIYLIDDSIWLLSPSLYERANGSFLGFVGRFYNISPIILCITESMNATRAELLAKLACLRFSRKQCTCKSTAQTIPLNIIPHSVEATNWNKMKAFLLTESFKGVGMNFSAADSRKVWAKMRVRLCSQTPFILRLFHSYLNCLLAYLRT